MSHFYSLLKKENFESCIKKKVVYELVIAILTIDFHKIVAQHNAHKFIEFCLLINLFPSLIPPKI